MTRYIDYKYIKNILDHSEDHSVETVVNARMGYAVLEWQNTVYGNKSMSDIMDAYTEYKNNNF